ncbi:MAG: nuclear transport factor 2 family protein [Acidimicrobiia bacterium]
MTANLQQWIEDYRLAWVNRDPDAAAALVAPDATYRSNIFEDLHVGQEGVRAYWSSVTSDQASGSPHGPPFLKRRASCG